MSRPGTATPFGEMGSRLERESMAVSGVGTGNRPADIAVVQAQAELLGHLRLGSEGIRCDQVPQDAQMSRVSFFRRST